MNSPPRKPMKTRSSADCIMAVKTHETLSYPDLVSWLTDFERLALLPVPGERTGLASSYDRESQYDYLRGRYLAWGANDDGDGIVRHEEGGDVLAELKGPGALVRIWSAAPGPGNLKLFIDGDQMPVLDAPFASFFDHSLPPFVWPNLVYTAGESVPGCNNYVPIPFKHSLKIVAAPEWGVYYHFTYVQFPQKGIESFSLPISFEDESALAIANHSLISPDLGNSEQPAGVSAHEIDAVVNGGATQAILDITGPAAIRHLRIKLDLPKEMDVQRRLLRELAIQATWDNDATPSIWSPIGDFFGFFGGAQTFRAYPMGIGPDAVFYSEWYMPFATRAKIEIANDGDVGVPIHCEITTELLRFPVSAYGRFHAKWHRDAFLPHQPDREPDWTILTTRGRGRYVGLHLHVWNPGGDWWGEGDEKFFIDGEKFPSVFGTGSEDYFGYAWSSAGLFSRPFHNQILNEDNAGHVVNNRWHLADSVPFQTAFEGYIEKYFPNDRPTLYAAVAYWYLAPGGLDPYAAAPLTERIGYWDDDSQRSNR